MTKTRVTILVENTATMAGLLGEHGLAYWIEYAGHKILFDSGQGRVLAANAQEMSISLDDMSALVLSHGHYDHTGGVAEVLKNSRPVTIYVHPAAFAPKYASRTDGPARYIGMSPDSARAIRDSHHRWIATERPTVVVEGLTVTGPVPRGNDFEDTGGPFFLDEACSQPDPLEDDQSLFFDTAEGIVVLLGCAHSGVVNTLHHVRRLTDNRPIRAVIGGMHLVGASTHRIERTIDELRRLGVERLAPAHCTGTTATTALWNAFPDKCRPCSVGTRFEFD